MKQQTTVFLSGSRSINTLHSLVQQRLINIITQGFRVVVGDADGVDRAFQQFLYAESYLPVTIFCAGEDCRNNVGSWPEKHVSVPANVRGRAFYTVKDKALAQEADYGFVVWDGTSKGSLANIEEVKRLGKKSLVFHNKLNEFQVA